MLISLTKMAAEAPPDVEAEIRSCGFMCLLQSYLVTEEKGSRDEKFYHCVYRKVDFEVLCFILLKRQYMILLGNYSAVTNAGKAFMISDAAIKSQDVPYARNLVDISTKHKCVYINRGESTVQIICSKSTYEDLCNGLFREDIDVYEIPDT